MEKQAGAELCQAQAQQAQIVLSANTELILTVELKIWGFTGEYL